MQQQHKPAAQPLDSEASTLVAWNNSTRDCNCVATFAWNLPDDIHQVF